LVVKNVKNQLIESAQEFGRSALAAFLGSRWRQSLQDSGTTLEHLAKAFLSGKHPSLIVDGTSFDALLHAASLPHSRIPADRIRTVNAREAVSRCAQMVPSLNQLRDDLILLIDVRNGVVHLGDKDEAASKRTLVPFLKACETFLKEAGEPRDRFWGDAYSTMVMTRISDSVKEAEVRAADAIASAKAAFDSRFAGQDTAVKSAIIKAIEASYDAEKYDEQLVDCPACYSTAILHGSTDVRWEAEYDYDGHEAYAVGVAPIVTFYAGHLNCRVCGLELDAEDELAAADVELSWDLDDVDPQDWVPYDEDWDRDR
jgi:hypothetical protein